MAVEERRQQNPTYGRAIPFRSGDVWNVLLAVQQIKTSNINVCRNWLSWTRAAGWNLGNQLRAKASHAMPQTCCGCEVGCLRGREGHQLTAVDSREEMYLIQTTKVTKATLCRGKHESSEALCRSFQLKARCGTTLSTVNSSHECYGLCCTHCSAVSKNWVPSGTATSTFACYIYAYNNIYNT